MAIFVTGTSTCATHPAVERISQYNGVIAMWVDCEERGRGLPGGTFPDKSRFETIIYLVSLDSLESTQMGVHFAECAERIHATHKLVFLIDDVLADPKYERWLGFLSDYRRIGPDELVAKCSQSGLHGKRV